MYQAIGFLMDLHGCFQKYGKPPQIIHFNRVFHDFHHPFWGTPIFWKHPHVEFTLEKILWTFFCLFRFCRALHQQKKIKVQPLSRGQWVRRMLEFGRIHPMKGIIILDLLKMLGKRKTYSPKWWYNYGDLPR